MATFNKPFDNEFNGHIIIYFLLWTAVKKITLSNVHLDFLTDKLKRPTLHFHCISNKVVVPI